MSSEVNVVETSARQATSLDQLKGWCRSELTAFAYMKYREMEKQRQAELHEKLKHTASRFKAVEQETTQLRSHLHKCKLQAMSNPLTGIPNAWPMKNDWRVNMGSGNVIVTH